MMKRKYYWKCHWTNGKGGFNPDYEGCSKKSRKSFKTAFSAALAAREHDKQHKWCGWGYQPYDWDNKETCVYYDTPTGKVRCVGRAFEIVGENKENFKLDKQ